ncbi:response regulator transcription factor [Kineococcus endophyticus]|uniref:Response regulator transcription factor n=1 Tax=Kineococcus endophyticus TaxID=1181883 RepID=A0ABV3P4N9_9ACTN
MDTLLVEDDPAIARALVEGLARYGFVVRHVTTGAQALREHAGAAVVLLDLGLPDGDGIDVCRALRAVSDVPLIIITARSDEVERVVGLEVGADDYLPKPFGMRELVARMRAVLRRTEGSLAAAVRSAAAPPEQDRGETPLRVGRLEVHRAARRVLVAGSGAGVAQEVTQEVVLSPKEFDLLEQLASTPGAVRTRDDLLTTVWDENFHGSGRTLDVHVGSLRRKLSGVVEVQTVRGVGFRLEAVAG